MKTEILAALGKGGLQQASALNAGLAANDRIKYGFSLLQMALEHAAHPEQPAPDLKREREAAGIDDRDFDDAISGARSVGRMCRIPGAARIIRRIMDDMPVMAAPVVTAHEMAFGPRVTALLGAPPGAKDDLVDPAAISAMTQAAHGPDSLHRLVMDLHKRLNALQAEIC